jgi:hypothetical protein
MLHSTSLPVAFLTIRCFQLSQISDSQAINHAFLYTCMVYLRTLWAAQTVIVSNDSVINE